MTNQESFEFKSKYKNISIAFILIGIVALAWGFKQDSHRAWANFLLNNYYFTCAALGALFFMAVTYAMKASWATGIRKIPEALVRFLPVGGILMLALYFGIHDLYHHWSSPEAVNDHILHEKLDYLNVKFFMIRLIGIVGLWVLFSRIILKNNREEEETGSSVVWQRNFKRACLFILLFAFSFSFASFDWIMSLEPHWFSTIFAVYNFAGMFVNSCVIMILILIFLKQRGMMPKINENHLHDLAKLVFAFSVFWAYIWISQFMLIWYANIPEETAYYFTRFVGEHYRGLFFVNVVLNFIIPFLALISRDTKRRFGILKVVCFILIIGHWLDLYLMIMPGTVGDHASIGLIELGSFLGFIGLFLFVVLKALSSHSLMPSEKTNLLEESLSYHQ